MDHTVIHHGLCAVSLGVMQREYVPLALPGLNNPEVMRGVIIRPPMTLEAELAWYDGLANRKNDILFAILAHEYDASGNRTGYRYIGHTGLHDITWPAGHATSGSIIIDKNCFGKGYGTEAKLLLLHDAFKNRGLRKVCSNVKVFNGNSWGHLIACGFRNVGRRKQHHFSGGTYVDDIQLEVFRDEWEAVWQKYTESRKLPRLSAEQRAAIEKETDLF